MRPLQYFVTSKVVGLVSTSVRYSVGAFVNFGMEDLENRWQRLSLMESEGKKVDLSRNKKNLSFVLAAKFFTRRAINIEAVARTFRSIW